MSHHEQEHSPLAVREQYSLVSGSVKNWNVRSIAIEVVFGLICGAIGLYRAYRDEAFWLAWWFGGMVGGWLVHTILLITQLLELRKQRHDHVKNLYWINLGAVTFIDLGALISFVFLKTTRPAYPNSGHGWIWAMAGLQLFPFIACLESTWRYRRYMLFITTHQHLDDVSLHSVPSRRTSRQHSSASRSPSNHAGSHQNSTATDSDNQHRGSPHQTTHSHFGALSRSTTFSRPNSSLTVAEKPYDPVHGHAPGHEEASDSFSLAHGRRGSGRREEGSSAEESSDEEQALVQPRKSSRRSRSSSRR